MATIHRAVGLAADYLLEILASGSKGTQHMMKWNIMIILIIKEMEVVKDILLAKLDQQKNSVIQMENTIEDYKERLNAEKKVLYSLLTHVADNKLHFR